MKPFQMEELMARLKALLRRASGPATSELICKGIRLNPDTQQVWLNDNLLDITASEYQLQRAVTAGSAGLGKSVELLPTIKCLLNLLQKV